MEQFRYFGTSLANQNSINEELRNGLKTGNACYHSVQNLLPSRFLSKNINIYGTVILPFVLYGCETCLSTLREERRLRVFKNRVLRRICGSKGGRVKGEGRKLHNEELNDLSLPTIIQVII